MSNCSEQRPDVNGRVGSEMTAHARQACLDELKTRDVPWQPTHMSYLSTQQRSDKAARPTLDYLAKDASGAKVPSVLILLPTANQPTRRHT